MRIRALTAALVFGLLPAFAAAQDYPSKPIHVVIAQQAGTSPDLAARYYGNKIQALGGQQVIVDSRPGAGGSIAAKAVASARPDGYTLFQGTTASQSANRYLFKSLPYDPARDFAPVAPVFRLAFLLAVNEKRTPVNSVAELTAYLKAKTTPLTYGWATASMLAAAEMYKSLIGIEATGVGYRPGPQQLQDLAAGEFDFTFVDATYGVSPVANQRSLAVTLDRRSQVLPQLPTMVEAGVAGFQPLSAWFAIYAPAGTPQPVIARLSGWYDQITRLPETREFLKSFAGEPFPGTPQMLAEYQEQEAKRWEHLVKLAKIQPQ